MNTTTAIYERTLRQLSGLRPHDNGTKEFTSTIQQFEPYQLLVPRTILSNPEYIAGELMWYASGSNKLHFINKYSKFWNKISDDGVTCRSAYGFLAKKIYGFDQIKKVIEILKKDPNSRQAIIQLYRPSLQETKDEICTLNIQFLLRNNRLKMHVNMRSNDINVGQRNDVIMFQFLQQHIALRLGVEVGVYIHYCGSLHLYERDFEKAKENVEEEVFEQQDRLELTKDFFERDLKLLIEFEKRLRFHIEDLYDPYDFLTVDARILATILWIKWKKPENPLKILKNSFGDIWNNGLLNIAINFYTKKELDKIERT